MSARIDVRALPPWYHGAVTRAAAEELLRSFGATQGLYLVRESSGPGYVLSICVKGKAISHYQITEVKGDEETLFTFATDIGVAPKFHSLSSVINYLHKTPEHLPTPLTGFVSREDPKLLHDTPKREENAQSTPATSASTKDATKTASTTTASGPRQSEDVGTGTADGQATPDQTMAVGGSILNHIKDRLSTQEGVKAEDIANGKVAETSKRFSDLFTHECELTVYSVPDDTKEMAEDIDTLKKATLSPGDKMQLLDVEREGDDVFVICRHSSGRRLKVAGSSRIMVVPSHTPAQHSPSFPGLSFQQDRSGICLRAVVEKHGLKLSTALSDHDEVFYREIIKEGYLSKLPPARNRIQRWRRRYFRLVLSLNRSLQGGPVFLEYIRTHKSRKLKGVIDLNTVLDIHMPSELDKQTVKSYNKDGILQNALFEIDMPRRTYRVLANSEDDCHTWLGTLRDVMGIDSEEAPKASESSADYRRSFDCILLSKVHHNPDARVVLTEKEVKLVCPQTHETVRVWTYAALKSFGYLHNVVWFEVGGKAAEGDAGLLCVSSRDAIPLFESLDFYAPKCGGKTKRRLSRRHNMSWTSIKHDDDEEDLYASIAELPGEEIITSTEPRVLFDKTLAADELEFVALAIPLHVYHAQKPNELSFLPGEAIRIAATKAFLGEGYYLGQKPSHSDWGLVAAKHVEVREHEFGFERDFDDNVSRDSIQDGDTSMIEEDRLYLAPRVGAEDDADDGGVYEVPNASSKKRVDVDDDDDGLTSGYVEHVRK